MNKERVDSKLHSILYKLLKVRNIFNAVLAVQSGNRKLDWAGAIGFADYAKKTKMQLDTPYFIASITKMYTSAVIMHLREQNLLNLDDIVSKYLPDSLLKGIHIHKGMDYARELKIVHLLSHRSGLADYFLQKQKDGDSILDKIVSKGDQGWDVNEVMAIVRQGLTPRFRPGEGSRAFYSDTNYQLLGEIIKFITKKPLTQAYDEIIFAPLNLKNTYLLSLSSQHTRPQPAPFYYADKLMNIPIAMSSFGPDGGIVSTTYETISFLRAFLNGTLFPEHCLKEMTQWNKMFFPLEYGYGLMHYKLPRAFSPFHSSPEFIGHSGASASFLFYCPDKDLYLSGTLNQMKEERRPFRLMMEVVNTLKQYTNM